MQGTGNAEILQSVRYYEEGQAEATSGRDEPVHRFTEQPRSARHQSLEGRKLSREQKLRNLSQPKHPKMNIKQLREKIESDIKQESRSKSKTLGRVQTLPQLAPESKRLIIAADKNDKDPKRSSRSTHLAVPHELHASKSDETLFVNSTAAKSPRVTELAKGLGSDRRRARSLTVNGERHPPMGGTGNQIDLRLLLPASEIIHHKPRHESDPKTRGITIQVPDLRIQLPD